MTWELWYTLAPVLVVVVERTLAVSTTAHVLLHKESTRAAVGWIALIWLTPLLGSSLYVVLGINRIQRRALHLRGRLAGYRRPPPLLADLSDERPPVDIETDEPLAALVRNVSGRDLLPGNAVELLENGDAAYPAMLDAIASARKSIGLCTYIFDDDAWGARFVEALADAHRRGVQVRVLVDGVGAGYSFPTVMGRLRRVEVPSARFLASLLPWRMAYLNLRNHRKVMVVDGEVAFTGGMNIRAGNVLGDEPKSPVQDLMAEVRGPVVGQLFQVFAVDWEFTTGEHLEGDAWEPSMLPAGPVLARALPDGPDEDFAIASWTLLGALACARRRVRILTPYFLPEDHFVTALNAVALRGVEVDLVMPEINNLPYVQWASWVEIDRLLDHGCRVWFSQGPFDHTKMMLVDDQWILIGSSNWDARSLRLNFELNMECWDPDLAAAAEALVQRRLAGARRITEGDAASRGTLRRLRDSAIRLFKPYL